MIYLDHHSTTPLDPAVFEEMKPYFLEKFGNASSSTHRFNWEAESAVSLARTRVAQLIGATDSEIVFTSGATESNHLAILGAAPELKRLNRTRVISSPIEHASVLGALELLQAQGFEIVWVRLDSQGRVDVDHFQTLCRDIQNLGLVSLSMANHEIGTIQPIAQLSQIAKAAGAWFHTDAVQAVGKMPLHVQAMGVDLLTLSSHKIHGPKGAGALYVRRRNPRVVLSPQMKGGQQERGLRPGTPNVPAIVGLGKAAQICFQTQSAEIERLRSLRDQLWNELSNQIPQLIRNGDPKQGLPNNLNVSVPGVDGSALFSRLKTVAVSNASACVSGHQDYSAVLTELGVSEALAKATLRFGVGRFNHSAEINEAAQEIAQVVRELRNLELEFSEQSDGELNL